MAVLQQQKCHFGDEMVTEEEKKKRTTDLFSFLSPFYDRICDVTSLGIHRIWKNALINSLNPQPGMKIVDMAGGTGDIAFRFLDYILNQTSSKDIPSHVTVCDISQGMLNVGRQRAEKLGYSDCDQISWLLADAENLPIESDSIDVYAISLGMRNVANIKKTLEEAYRILKPGGRFICLELSRVTNPILRKLYDLYSFGFIPLVQRLILGNCKSPTILVESIRQFPDQETFKVMIQDAGFQHVTYENLMFGVVAIHSGFKPS